MTRRLLFVSGASTGGAFRSTLELAEALRRRGHETEVLVEAPPSIGARVADRLLDAEVRLDNPVVTAIVDPVRRRLGARARRSRSPLPHLVAPRPENAVSAIARRRRADAVVVTSIRRPAWRQIRGWCRGASVLSVLYMRGVSELRQLEHPDGAPDLLIANTRSVAEQARAVGHDVVYVPSLVDLSRSTTDTTREVALLVSPTELQGVETALALASARPDVRFVLQESWELDDDAERRLRGRVAGLANVEIRPRTNEPAEIYRDTRLLLTPHRVDNRPRVVLEAQANGIPVLASAWPGLVDQVGDGGSTVPLDADDAVWTAEFSRLWDDPAVYDDLSARARRWAHRPEQDESAILDQFESSIEDALDRPMGR